MTGTGDWLKRARLRVKYQRAEDLAADMGVTRSAVANWETERTRPSMANAERLAALLKRPRSEVLGRFGYPIGGGEPLTVLPTVIPPSGCQLFGPRSQQVSRTGSLRCSRCFAPKGCYQQRIAHLDDSSGDGLPDDHQDDGVNTFGHGGLRFMGASFISPRPWA